MINVESDTKIKQREYGKYEKIIDRFFPFIPDFYEQELRNKASNLLMELAKYSEPTFLHSVRVADYMKDLVSFEESELSFSWQNFWEKNRENKKNMKNEKDRENKKDGKVNSDTEDGEIISISSPLPLDFEKHLQLVSRMGLFHDIGKIVVPNELLSSRSITSEEFSVIKTHTRAGYVLLKNICPYCACAAGKHHSAYAVKEYPEGIDDEIFTNELTKYIGTSLGVSSTKEYVDTYIKKVSLCDFYDALMTRNNDAFSFVDKQDPKQVKSCLEKYFPDQKKGMFFFFLMKFF